MTRYALPHAWILFLLALWTGSPAAPKLSPTQIKYLYVEGEFETIRVILEDFLKKSGHTALPKEKMLAYKYLGVVYASESQGYPIAESYFYKLLKLAPKAHLSDLYVSSAVESVFVKTQKRFQKESRDNLELDEFGNPLSDSVPMVPTAKDSVQPTPFKQAAPGPKPKSFPKREAGIRIWPWAVGLGVVGMVGGYFWVASKQKSKPDIRDGT